MAQISCFAFEPWFNLGFEATLFRIFIPDQIFFEP